MSEGHSGLTDSAGSILAEQLTSQNNDRDKQIDQSVETGTSSLGTQKLPDTYRVIPHENARKYYRTGRVFNTVWIEKAIEVSLTAGSPVPLKTALREREFREVRWFIVIRAHKTHSLCVPIHTYRGLGRTKSGISGKFHVPLVLEGLSYPALPDDPSVEPPLRIILENPGAEIKGSSTVDFSKLYTVEYAWGIMTIGRVHAKDMTRLRNYAAKAVLGEKAEDFSTLNRVQQVAPGVVEREVSLKPFSMHRNSSTSTALPSTTSEACQSIYSGSSQPDQVNPKQTTSTPGKHNVKAVNPEFKVRHNGFFSFGKVFKVFWPEIVRQTDTQFIGQTPAYDNVSARPRLFIVVRRLPHFCVCLPLITYNNAGVARHGAVKKHHCIAFMSQAEPPPKDSELPINDEQPMRSGIRILPKRRHEKLSPMSRIDFGRPSTIETNLKVYEYGEVDPQYHARLKEHWHVVSIEDVEDYKNDEEEVEYQDFLSEKSNREDNDNSSLVRNGDNDNGSMMEASTTTTLSITNLEKTKSSLSEADVSRGEPSKQLDDVVIRP